MKKEIVGFSSVSENELINTDGGIALETAVACILWGAIAGATAYLFKLAFGE